MSKCDVPRWHWNFRRIAMSVAIRFLTALVVISSTPLGIAAQGLPVGADAGWFDPTRTGRWHFRIADKGKDGEIRGICFWQWRPNVLAKFAEPAGDFALDLSTTEITDKALQELAQFKLLKTLDLSSTSITGTGCKELASLQKLE